MYLDLQQSLEEGDNMAMYYEIGITIDGVESCVYVDTNATPVDSWKQAVEHVMSLANVYHPQLKTEFDFVKEYEIDDEPKNLGYIFQPQAHRKEHIQ